MLLQVLFERVEAFLGTGMQEPDRADLLKALRQPMLQEALDEFHRRECHGGPGFLARLRAEGDVASLHPDNSLVGQGDARDGGCQVCESGSAITDRLAMHIPGCCPGFGRHVSTCVGVGSLQGIAECGPEDRAQG